MLIGPTTLFNSRGLRYFTFFYLYIMQGLPAGFALTAFSNYMTAKGVSSATVGSFVALVGLPWMFQFIWGPVIDRYQHSTMGRRKPWVLGAQALALLASLGLLLVEDPLHHISLVSAAFLCHSVFASIQDASVDALAISVTPEAERGRMNGFMRIGYLVGTGLAAATFSVVIKVYGFHQAALIQSGVLFVFMLMTCFVRERPGDAFMPGRSQTDVMQKRSDADLTYKNLLSELSKGLFSVKSLVTFGAVVLVYLSISLFVRAYNFYMIRDLGWEDVSVSFMTGSYGMLVASVIALAGGFIADKTGPQKLLIYVIALIGLYLLLFNAFSRLWPHQLVAQSGLVSLYFMDPALSICAMPVLMSICRKNVEGSQFTTYMALVNFADIVGSFASGKMLQFIYTPMIGLLAGGLCMLALMLLLLQKKPFITPVS